MPYITNDYYLNDYLGAGADDKIIAKSIKRAEDVIDALTFYRMVDDANEDYKAFDQQRPFIQTQVKKAVAALAEHYVLQGGYDATRQLNVGSASIGDFTFSADEFKEIPETVIALLSTTGLMHAGVRSGYDNGLYYIGWWY